MTRSSNASGRVAPLKSFYDLTVFAAPGGCSVDTHYIRSTLDEVRRDLEELLTDSLNLYLFCWYGASLTLDVYQLGEQRAVINVLPHLTVSIDGYPTITFDEAGKPVGYDFKSGDEEMVTETSLSGKMFRHELEAFNVQIDWEAMAVPPLDEPVAQPGDLVNVEDEWHLDDGEQSEEELLDEGFLRCGYNDLVGGEYA